MRRSPESGRPIGLRGNTGDLGVFLASAGWFGGWDQCDCGGRGGLRWWVCLRCQLVILRLMTRGLERCLRGGGSRSSSSRVVRVRARLSREGGKCRLVGDVAAGDANGS
jgi:hypothetical protein